VVLEDCFDPQDTATSGFQSLHREIEWKLAIHIDMLHVPYGEDVSKILA